MQKVILCLLTIISIIVHFNRAQAPCDTPLHCLFKAIQLVEKDRSEMKKVIENFVKEKAELMQKYYDLDSKTSTQITNLTNHLADSNRQLTEALNNKEKSILSTVQDNVNNLVNIHNANFLSITNLNAKVDNKGCYVAPGNQAWGT